MDTKKVLIIDDEEEIRRLLSEFLTESGYRTVTAGAVTEAIRLFEVERPHVVLLDLKMPGFQGDSFVSFVRRQDAHIPIIIISGYLTPDIVKGLLRLGANGFITKPLRLDRVLMEIEKISLPEQTPSPSPEEAAESVVTAEEHYEVLSESASLPEEKEVTVEEEHEALSEETLLPEGEEEASPEVYTTPEPVLSSREDGSEVVRIEGHVGRWTGDVSSPEADIEISGNVSKGPYRVCGKNITIASIVEPGTLIEASQNLTVKEGIFGAGRVTHHDQGKVERHKTDPNEKWLDEVRVGGTLRSKFIRNRTKVTARNLEVEQDIAFSTVEVSCRGRADQVIGGSLTVSEYFEVNKLGAPGGTATKIEIGADLGKHQHLKDMEERIPIREHFLSDLKKRYDSRPVQHLQAERDRYIQERRERGDAHPEDNAVAKGLVERIQQRRAELEQLRAQIEATERTLISEQEEHDQIITDIEASFKAELVVRGVIYPGVTVQMRGSTYQGDHELRGVRFYFKEDQVAYEYISLPTVKLRRPLRRK